MPSVVHSYVYLTNTKAITMVLLTKTIAFALQYHTFWSYCSLWLYILGEYIGRDIQGTEGRRK